MGGKSGGYSGPSGAEIATRDQGLKDRWTEEARVKEAQEEAFQLQLKQEMEALAAGDKEREIKTELESREGAAALSASNVGYKRTPTATEEDEILSLLGGV